MKYFLLAAFLLLNVDCLTAQADDINLHSIETVLSDSLLQCNGLNHSTISSGFDFIKLKPTNRKSAFSFRIHQDQSDKICFIEMTNASNGKMVFAFDFYYLTSNYVLMTISLPGGTEGDKIFYAPSGEWMILDISNRKLLYFDQYRSKMNLLDHSLIPTSSISFEEGKVIDKKQVSWKKSGISISKYLPVREITISGNTKISKLFDLLENGNFVFNAKSRANVKKMIPYDLQNNILLVLN